jgi:hypothetical protein
MGKWFTSLKPLTGWQPKYWRISMLSRSAHPIRISSFKRYTHRRVQRCIAGQLYAMLNATVQSAL